MCEIKHQIPEGPWTHLQYVNQLTGWNSTGYITPNSAKCHSFRRSSCILWYYSGSPLPLSCGIMKATATRVQSELPFHCADIGSATPDLLRPHSEVQLWAVKISLLRHTMKAIPKTYSTYKSQVRNPEQNRLFGRIL